MTYARFRYLVAADLYRVAGFTGAAAFVNAMRWNPGFNYSFWFRLGAFCESLPGAGCVVARWTRGVLYRKSLRFGIEIPAQTSIGPGLYIGHFGGIVVHPDTVIGRDCNLSQGVTIGRSNRGERQGAPVLGSRVYVAPGAKISGAIKLGDDVAVGANAVVTRDVPDHTVVVGVPAKPISTDGSQGYINRIDYPHREEVS